MNDLEKKPLYRILSIDDNKAIHQDFAKILIKTPDTDADLDDLEASLFGATAPKTESLHLTLDCATQGAEGLTMVEQALEKDRPYALAFVDSRMPPGMDGIETIRELWKRDPELQIVLCTAYSDYSWQEIRNILGETDNLLILKKPFDTMEVLQMTHALTRKWDLAREVKSRLHQLTFYDTLTSLPNRAILAERLSMALEHAKQEQSLATMLFLDMDNFKLINDSLGHSFGDKLLKIIAERIVDCLRASDIPGRWTAARIGGDEFIVILPQIASEHIAAVMAQRIADTIAQPLILEGHEILVTSSIGIAIYPQDGETEEELLKNADLAMYAAKRSGKNTLAYYQETMNIQATKRLTMENLLRSALDRNELSLHYQPQMNLHTGKVSGLEALLRWRNPILGQVPPLEFIEVAEEIGLIIDIGTWVMRTACAQVKTWIDQGLSVPRIAVNVSIKQFSHPDFVATIKNILAETGLDPQLLEVEITETLFGENVTHLEQIMHELREMRISIAIDDFGTGYAGISRLMKAKVDCLKIDKSFVNKIESNTDAQNLIKGILALAQCINLNVIAEGIETSTQMEFLRSYKCQQIQGYLYSKPLTADATEAFLRNPPKTFAVSATSSMP
ncbi:MAG: GGDEF domain-containing response regulator [Deltaproteobacteria bacterium]|nr:MAG: GGDEF domain-containing response regulator [Deltaproteobacteria bacterium]